MSATLRSRRGLFRQVGIGIGAGLLEVVCTIVLAASTVNLLSETTEDIGTLVAVAVVASLVGLSLGVHYCEQWFGPSLVAGGLTGAFLLLRGQAFLVRGDPISYPLLFGPPGVAVTVGVTLGTGWLGSRSTIAQRLSPAHRTPLARLGVAVAGGWTAIEFLFGLGLASTIGSVLTNTFVGVLVATIVGFPVAASFAVQYGQRHGIDRSDWGYTTDTGSLAAGFLVGVLTTLAVYGVGFVTATVGGTGTTMAAVGFLLTDLEAGLWVVALFALAHGLVAPVTEELAWRGVVQTALVRSEGAAVGIAVTAVLFTAKHALLDASLARVPTVLLLALVLGVVRDRLGTTASTVVHAVVNLTSVGLLAVLVLS